MRPDFAQLLHGHKELRKLQGASSLCVPGQRPTYHQRLLIPWKSTGLAPSPSNATIERCSKRVGKGISSAPVCGLEREVCRDTEDKQCLNGRVWKTISQGWAVRHDRAFNEWAVIKCLVIFSSVFLYAFIFVCICKNSWNSSISWSASDQHNSLCVCVSLQWIRSNSYVKIPWENPGMTA